MNKPKFDPNLPFSAVGLASKPAFDPNKEFREIRDEKSEIESLLRGAAQGATLGYSDEITGALESLVTDKSYEEARDESRQAYKQAREDNPISYGAGEIGASIGTAFVPGLGALNAAKGASLATRAGLGALQGGISASGLSEGKDAGEILTDTAIGATIGGALPIAIDKVIVPGAKALNSGAKKVLKTISGVDSDEYSKLIPAAGAKIQGFSDSDINKIVDYADNPELYKNTKSIEAIKNEIDNVNLQNKLYVDTGKQVLAKKKADLSGKIEDFKRRLTDSAQDFRDASNRLEQNLKSVNPPEDVYNDVLNSVAKLKKHISEGSTAAFEILDDETVIVPKQDIVSQFKDTLNKLKIDDNAPIGSVAQKDFNSLAIQIERLGEYPEHIKGSSLKRIIQDLDNELEYAESLGDISSRANAAKKQLRHSLDAMLKDRSENYADMMAFLEKDSKLLQKANKLFGTEDKALQKINTLSLDANNTNLDTLNELNPDARKKLENYLRAKYNLSPSRFRDQQMALPQFQNLTNENREMFNKNGRLLNNLERADVINSKFSKDIQNLDKWAEEFGYIEMNQKENYIHPSNTQGLVESYLKPSGPKIEPSKRLQQLTDITGEGPKNIGEKLENDLRQTAVAKVFDRSTTNGSRNTLMGASVLGAAGTAIGGPVGGALGAGIGGASGYFSDKLSGVLLKGSIDTVHTLKQYAPRLGKFAEPLIKAAERGNNSLAATMFLLQQSNPEFRQMMKQLEEEE